MDKPIGERIVELREEFGLSQVQFIETVTKLKNDEYWNFLDFEISLETINKIENGSQKLDATELVLICEAFGISTRKFFNKEPKISIIACKMPTLEV